MKTNSKKTNRTIIIFIIGNLVYLIGFLGIILSFTEHLGFPIPLEKKQPIAHEINFFIGLLLLCTGSILLMNIIEKSLSIQENRKNSQLLYSFLGPLGIMLFRRVDKEVLSRKTDDSVLLITQKSITESDRIAGMVFTVFVTLFIICSVYQWFTHNIYSKKTSPKEMQKNEIFAFERLNSILEAQRKYRQTDWNSDGEKTYALFLVHLWKTVDENVYPVPVNLIQKRLAIAMRRSFALDGYCYVDIHYYNCMEEDMLKKKEFDIKNEFTVAAFPVEYKKTGRLSFIINSAGKIISKSLEKIPPDRDVGLFIYPHNPTEQGWIEINDYNELRTFQKKILYE